MDEVTRPPLPKTSSARPRGAWWKRLASLAVSLAVCLLILEVYARLTFQGQWPMPRSAVRAPGIFSAMMQPNIEVDLTLADGVGYHVSTNARGFRGPLVSSIADRPLRVVSVGDSLTFAWGLPLEEHAMARFTASYGKAHPERGLAHAFVATPGWDPKDYYFAYLTEVLPTRPEVIVLGFFAGNDILPSSTPELLDPKDAPVITALPEAAPRPWLRFPAWAQTQLSSSLLVAKVGVRFGVKPATFVRFEKDLAAQEKLWEPTFFYLEALASAVKKNGGRLVILSYPSSLQVNAGRTLDAAGMDHTMPDRVLEAFCAKKGIDVITLLGPFEGNNQNLDLFFPKDRHITARGQEVIAKVLDDKLGPIVDRAWEDAQRAR
jgi:hypothetical protein